MTARAGGAARKRCQVAYATRERQYLWSVELPAAATIADALSAARRAAGGDAAALDPALWDEAPVGVFGEPRARSALCEDGDRIELYRPLRADPRARRRERVQRERRRPGA
ncbi:MAG TPA: RnfH family protein [Steroidobacteraceae bacterium]|nr:RnfH family protein [Steroidobacteraceae bacterium]